MRTRRAAALFAATLSLALTGCMMPMAEKDPSDSQSSSKPAAEVLHRMMELTEESVQLHGGRWTYADPDETVWDVNDPSGFLGITCPGSKTTSRYDNFILGPAAEDPSAAVEEYVAHFEQQGFVETNRFDADVPSDIGSGYYTTLTMKGDDGGLLVYQAGNHLSSLSVQSPCTDDPAMKIRPSREP
ncbi:hypothetical protein NNX28_12300 [Arthrobacter sp. zg-Y859]|uniref:Lipoprotein n=1 Tax=Arthrobacter jinronghuae TaxID=2964609 RepID=A0ABT1NSY7_9MICC|nr:hypothetical protein [Arthrobacter jinronghuae]MCQ1950701.1 hypothetical protein [Arthrobacter jinronghuae]UWX79175.1 hypothetical protein N2K98_02890 [Arthrobacter jinronghuae]